MACLRLIRIFPKLPGHTFLLFHVQGTALTAPYFAVYVATQIISDSDIYKFTVTKYLKDYILWLCNLIACGSVK